MPDLVFMFTKGILADRSSSETVGEGSRETTVELQGMQHSRAKPEGSTMHKCPDAHDQGQSPIESAGRAQDSNRVLRISAATNQKSGVNRLREKAHRPLERDFRGSRSSVSSEDHQFGSGYVQCQLRMLIQ